MGFEKAKDIESGENYMILIYGSSGTGKTTAGAMLPNVAIMLTEPNGLKSIQDANPDASVWEIKTLSDLRSAYKFIRDDIAVAKLEKRKPMFEWLVQDSFTDLQQMIKDESDAKIRKDHDKKKSESVDSDWNYILEKSEEVIRMLRDLKGINKLIICREEAVDVSKVSPDDGSSKTFMNYAPKVLGRKQIPEKLSGACNITGRIYKIGKFSKRKVALEGGKNKITKGHPNLKRVEGPNISEWIRKMSEPVDIRRYQGFGIDNEITDEEAETTSNENTEKTKTKKKKKTTKKKGTKQ